MSVSELLQDVRRMFAGEPDLAVFFGYDPAQIACDEELLAAVLAACLAEGRARDRLRALAGEVFAQDPQALEMALEDLLASATRDRDPGGMATTLHFSNGFHLLLSYRVTRALWLAGREALALTLKGQFTRALGGEIWPQAQIGRGVWLDHGLGVVIGQTAVIEDDVCLWHGVTLGSTLAALGPNRHPIVRRGVTIGAGATLLGGIEIGAGAVIAAGALVLRPVAAGAIIAGPRAEERPRREGSFAGFASLAQIKQDIGKEGA